MKTTENGISLIKKFEGFSRKLYLCPAGKLTIGYGHVVLAGEKFPPDGISEDMAEDILKKDLLLAENAINSLVIVPISQNQFDAIASLTYNIGAKNFAKSTLLHLINENKIDEAAKEFPKWVFSGGNRLKGLENRRKAEAELFASSPLPLGEG